MDKYLSNKGIYPNDKIYKGNHKFKGGNESYIYPPNLGLEESRKKALRKNIEEKDSFRTPSKYENVIVKNRKYESRY